MNGKKKMKMIKVAKPIEEPIKKDNAYVERMKSLHLDAFIKNKLNGNYHAVRARAILDQVKKEEFGMWNGIVYTKECLEAEYWLAKHSAIKSFAGAQVNFVELKKLGSTPEEVNAHFKSFIDSDIFKEDYSEFMDDADDKVAGFKE
jgi:hypothetical protein